MMRYINRGAFMYSFVFEIECYDGEERRTMRTQASSSALALLRLATELMETGLEVEGIKLVAVFEV